MPYIFEKKKLTIPLSKDRRKKLTCEQKIEIRENPNNISIHQLAKDFGVSRRLIQFIRFPERHAKNLQDRQERGGTMQYYNKDKHRETMKEYRKYKKELFDKNELQGE